MKKQTITAQDLADAISMADQEVHATQGLGWFDTDHLDDVIIDGRINLIRVAEILSGKD